MADELLRNAYTEYQSKSDGRISYPEFCAIAKILTRAPAALPEGYVLVVRKANGAIAKVMKRCESGELSMAEAWDALVEAAAPTQPTNESGG